MAEPYVGQIIMVGFNWAIRGYALCQGQLMSVSSNTALFSLLGTDFGGDGKNTFALPDLRGRTAIGQGHGPGLTPRIFGHHGGEESVTLSVNQMPSHTHTATLNAENTPASVSASGGNLLAQADIYAPAGRAANAAMSGEAITVSNAGGSQPVDNMEPFLVMNYSIALMGIYPSRN